MFDILILMVLYFAFILMFFALDGGIRNKTYDVDYCVCVILVFCTSIYYQLHLSIRVFIIDAGRLEFFRNF